MSGSPFQLDAPGTACHFDSNGCSGSMLGHGGFDQHHPTPIELGGDPTQPLLPLCPNHHRRQHSLVRYLVQQLLMNLPAEWDVLDHFTAAERDMAEKAAQTWDSFGRPVIAGWPCPAARA